MKRVIHICCAAERNYVAHSAAMLASVLRHRGENEVHVHYLHGPGWPSRLRRRLEAWLRERGAQISFCAIPNSAVDGLPIRGFTRRATWYRIFLPDLLPTVERILYLDVDTAVLSDLAPLWDMPLDDHLVAAVTNVFQADHVHRAAALGMEPARYFNAGVLLMNLELMRREGTSKALYDCAIGDPHRVRWRDQDTLNLVLADRRLPLHPRWNCMHSVLTFPASVELFGREAVDEARRDPAIRHWEGPGRNKPWHPDYVGEDRDLYLENRRETPWPRVLLEGYRARDLAARMSEVLWQRWASLRYRVDRALPSR